MARAPRLGDLLVEARLIDEFQLQAALGHQRRFGNRLGVALVKLGFLREEDLMAVLAQQLGLPVVRLAGKRIAPDVLARVPEALLEKHGCLPLFVRREGEQDVLYVGLADPCDRSVRDDLARVVRMPLRPVLVAPTDLHDAVTRLLRTQAEPEEAHRASGSGAPEVEDTTPLVLSDETSPTEPHAAGAADSSRGRPREVRTRVILHALTQILIEKGVIERGALVARVEALERLRGD
jgi:hypothetical protein